MKVSPSTTWYFDYQHQSHYPTQASLESVATASNTTHCGGTSLPLKSNAPFPLNTKEYIAAVIAALISLQNDPCEHPCVLSLGDSSTTTSWLHKSNHVPASSPVHNEIARWHASNLLEHQASDYSQHIAGSDNHVADSLSRDFHLNDEQLLSLLKHACPHLSPSNSQVISLPTHLSSWIGSLAQLQPKKRELVWRPKQSTIAAGVTGWTSSGDAASPTPILIDTHRSIVPRSSGSGCLQTRNVQSPGFRCGRHHGQGRRICGYDHQREW